MVHAENAKEIKTQRTQEIKHQNNKLFAICKYIS